MSSVSKRILPSLLVPHRHGRPPDRFCHYIVGHGFLQLKSNKVIPIVQGESRTKVVSVDTNAKQHVVRELDEIKQDDSSTSIFSDGASGTPVHNIRNVESTREKTVTNQSNVHDATSPTSKSNDGRDVAAALKVTVEQAVVAGKKLRFRLVMCTTATGIVILVASLFMVYLIQEGVLSRKHFGPVHIYANMLFPFLFYSLLGVMPNDAFIIRMISGFMVFLFCASAVLQSWSGVDRLIVRRHETTDFDGETTVEQCGADLPDAGCFLWSIEQILFSLVLFGSSIGVGRNLMKSKGERYYDGRRLAGFKFKDTAFRIPARAALENIWDTVRFILFYWCVADVAVGIALHLLEDRAPFFTEDMFRNRLVGSSVSFVLCLMITSERRRRTMAFLTSCVVENKTKSAASIAALIGGVNALCSLDLARTRFRSIDLKHVSGEDFGDHRKSEGDTDALYRQTTISTLGTVDVFISHSWHDNGTEKFKALKNWSEEFEEAHGRPPQLWLDKACIDQSDIATNLLCLPLFLGGCRTLLILAGPTYIERLWCVLEIFVFLQMGGTIEQIEIIPIGIDNCEGAENIFHKADINKCKCFLESDRQMILGIVQQGFGSFDAFNETLREVFVKRMATFQVVSSKTRRMSFQQPKDEHEGQQHQHSIVGQALLHLESTKVVPVTSNEVLAGGEKNEICTNVCSNDQGLISIRAIERDDHRRDETNTVDSSSKQDDDGRQTVNESTSNNHNKNQNRLDQNQSNDNDVAVTTKLQTIIEEAAVAGKKLRFRLVMCTSVVGVWGIVVCALIHLLVASRVLSRATFGSQYIYLTLMFLWIMYALLGIMPNDGFTIRIMSLILEIFFFLGSVASAYAIHNSWFVARHEITGFEHGETSEYYCGADLPDVGCGMYAFMVAAPAACFYFGCGVSIRRNLVRVRGRKIYDKSRNEGLRYQDFAFKTPARAALERLWAACRIFVGFAGVTFITTAVVWHLMGDRIVFFNEDFLPRQMMQGSISLCVCFIFTPERRRRTMAFLTSMLVDDKSKAAASIAALIGGVNASNTLEVAQTKFRSISLNHVAAEDFDDVAKSEGNTDALYTKTICKPLGAVDVFISHSWHDNGRKKFKALQNWAEDFENENGRLPEFWLDKACIDQSDIATNLLCLPIFVGGCQTLLILAGPTYIERLWCVLEIFVFLQMGGTIEQIEIIPIDIEQDEGAASMFQTADINKCKCFLDSDRHMILGIVQQGFGSFDAFNTTLREVFLERMTNLQICSSKSTRSLRTSREPKNKYEIQPRLREVNTTT